VYSFDGDAAGRKAAWRALEVSLPLATDQKRMRFLFLPTGHDPDTYIREYGKEAFERLASEAPLLSEFLVNELGAQVNLRSAEGRSSFLVAAKDHLQRITAPALKLLLIKEVAAKAGVTQEEAEEALQMKPPTTFRRTAPARRQSLPPSSAEWKLLSRVACYPGLALEIALDLVDPALEESQLLVEIAGYCKGNEGAENVSNAMLIEHFKDSPHADLLFRAQTHALELKESQADSLQFVRHTVCKLDIARKNKEIKSLEERLRKGQLNKDEHRDYARMISEVKALELRLQADARGLVEQRPG
jgi:DNA primase